MRSFLKTAASISSSDNDPEMISFWAADNVLEPENDLPELVSPRNRFMRRVLSDTIKRRMWERFVSRARALNSAHVLDHFSEVTGHTVQDVATCMGRNVPKDLQEDSLEVFLPVEDRRQEGVVARRSGSVVSTEAKKALGLSSFGSTPRRKKTRRRVQKMGMQALTSAFGVYLMLVMAGSWEPVGKFETGIRQLPDYSWIELGSHPRGRFIEPNLYLTGRYKVAVRKLQRANTSIFGYLPGFKRDLLNEGILELESVIAYQKSGGYIYAQALMLLADAYVRAGQPIKAIPVIEEVIRGESKQAPEARAMLIKLRKKGLYTLVVN